MTEVGVRSTKKELLEAYRELLKNKAPGTAGAALSVGEPLFEGAAANAEQRAPERGIKRNRKPREVQPSTTGAQ